MRKLGSYRNIQLIVGILYIMLSLFAMKYVQDTTVLYIQIFGVFSMIKGFFEMINYRNIKKRMNNGSSEVVLATGCVDILIGANLIIFVHWKFETLMFLFGLWFLLNALLNIYTSSVFKEISVTLWRIIIIVYSLCLFIAIGLILQIPKEFFSYKSMIGSYFLLFGLVKIITSIINKKDIHQV